MFRLFGSDSAPNYGAEIVEILSEFKQFWDILSLTSLGEVDCLQNDLARHNLWVDVPKVTGSAGLGLSLKGFFQVPSWKMTRRKKGTFVPGGCFVIWGFVPQISSWITAEVSFDSEDCGGKGYERAKTVSVRRRSLDSLVDTAGVTPRQVWDYVVRIVLKAKSIEDFRMKQLDILVRSLAMNNLVLDLWGQKERSL